MRHSKTITAACCAAGLVISGLWLAAAGAAGETVVINEIHYNPPDADDPADTEFFELHNPGTSAIDVTGYTIDDGASAPDETLTLSGSIAAGGYVIISSDSQDAVDRWGVTPFAIKGFGLSGGGDTITVRDAGGSIVDEVTYDDRNGWAMEPDGSGSSLELLDVASDLSLIHI